MTRFFGPATWTHSFIVPTFLTTRTVDWFEQLGFAEVDLDSLPAKKRDTYNHARKSRILAIDLKDRKPIKSSDILISRKSG